MRATKEKVAYMTKKKEPVARLTEEQLHESRVRQWDIAEADDRQYDSLAPEKNLISAMILRALADAQEDFNPCAVAINRVSPAMKLVIKGSALSWLNSPSDEPFSYLWCCDVLGVDAKRILSMTGNLRDASKLRRAFYTHYFSCQVSPGFQKFPD